MAYTSEDLRAALKVRLVDNISAALDDVEAIYAATDPIALAEPVTWHEGHNPGVLLMESTEFPFVAVLVGSRRPDRSVKGRAQWGYQEFEPVAWVDYFVVADELATVNKIVHRYARAIVAILQGERYISGCDFYKQVDFEPEVNISEASRHPKIAKANMLVDTEADIDYIQAGRVVVPFEGST